MNLPALSPRQIAGKQNQLKSKGITAEGRQSLRAAAIANQPWKYSTGPQTANGKARSAANNKYRRHKANSIRELRKQVADVSNQVKMLRQLRNDLLGAELAKSPLNG